ncbi:MAG TPA: hypothetical protein VNN18_03850 [Candidatus Xenobia bacterium]|nr:hypothetical protein [Candidatus Xenobia bacterium]
MECLICGRVLPPLTEVLAQTPTGTHCPHCWTRVRRPEAGGLRLVPVVAGKRKSERRAPALRRAA